MLVLTRRINEAIVLSNGVRIVVGQIRRGQVKLVIEAPPQIAIARSELIEKDRKARKEAQGFRPHERGHFLGDF
jgi:carbon storage regulator